MSAGFRGAIAREVRWRTALAAREAALRESGLDECRWMNAHAEALLECTSVEALHALPATLA